MKNRILIATAVLIWTGPYLTLKGTAPFMGWGSPLAGAEPAAAPADTSSAPFQPSVHAEGDHLVAIVEGVGDTRATAMDQAWLEAVRLAVGMMIEARTEVDQQKVAEKIIAHSRGVVDGYEILMTDQQGDVYRVRMKAKVRPDLLRDGLEYVASAGQVIRFSPDDLKPKKDVPLDALESQDAKGNTEQVRARDGAALLAETLRKFPPESFFILKAVSKPRMAAGDGSKPLTAADYWRGRFGFQVQPVTEETAAAFGLAGAAGVQVACVLPNGPADSRGVSRGDVILKVGDQTIKDYKDLPKALTAIMAGAELPVEVVRRAGRSWTAPIKVGAMPGDESAAKNNAQSAGDQGAVADKPDTYEMDFEISFNEDRYYKEYVPEMTRVLDQIAVGKKKIFYRDRRAIDAIRALKGKGVARRNADLSVYFEAAQHAPRGGPMLFEASNSFAYTAYDLSSSLIHAFALQLSPTGESDQKANPFDFRDVYVFTIGIYDESNNEVYSFNRSARLILNRVIDEELLSLSVKTLRRMNPTIKLLYKSADGHATPISTGPRRLEPGHSFLLTGNSRISCIDSNWREYEGITREYEGSREGSGDEGSFWLSDNDLTLNTDWQNARKRAGSAIPVVIPSITFYYPDKTIEALAHRFTVTMTVPRELMEQASSIRITPLK